MDLGVFLANILRPIPGTLRNGHLPDQQLQYEWHVDGITSPSL